MYWSCSAFEKLIFSIVVLISAVATTLTPVFATDHINQYNVFEVNKTGYDNCTTEGAVGNWSSGKDFIPLNEAKRYYFICGNGQCFNGMKVSVVVHPLPPPPTASLAHELNQQNSTAAALPRPGFRALVVSFALILFGSTAI
ncbi:hypothetical protein TIFTF001_005918 [Ficus carica]|uniref:Phytocyanin domain-containing protein n=1 Tax=Ficus carica TaxID=3494 RepID=A0AA88CZ63_FICCA|nr:hypothetical protein TIFTF001_005918 [Ficus carica]